MPNEEDDAERKVGRQLKFTVIDSQSSSSRSHIFITLFCSKKPRHYIVFINFEKQYNFGPDLLTFGN